MEFQKGMDLSFIPELEDAGVQVKDFDGTVMDPLDLVQKYGVNSVRLRIWNAPEHVRESGGYCSYAHTLAMAKRIRAHGMSFMLDFHYSDFWADPGQQRKPKDWENLSFKELKEAVFSYTRDTLTALKEEDVLPDIVQIGNEIRSGLLFPDGELPDYTKMVQLVNAGIRGARAAAGKDEMQVMIHLDQGGRYFYLKEWFDCSFEAGLEDFDLIGLSYYPFWHGTFTDLKETMTKLIQDCKKPIMVVETAHAWRKSAHGFIDEQQEKIAGFPATPAGQKQVLDLVANIVASLPDEMGQGIYYWEPICVPKDGEGGWSENMGLLEEKGTIMEGIRSFLFTRNDACPEKPAKIYEPEPMTVVKDEACGLPEMLPVLLYDGMVEQRRVNWNEVPDTRVRKCGRCSVCCTCEDLRGGRAAGGGESVARCRLGRRPGALERRKIRGCRCSTAVSGVCRSVPSSAGECGTRRSTEKLYVFDLPDGKGTGGRNVYIICCLSGNRYNKCGCAAVPQYGRGKRRDCDSSDRTCMDRLQSDMRNQKTAGSHCRNPNFIAADVRHDAEFLSADSKKRGTIRR